MKNSGPNGDSSLVMPVKCSITWAIRPTGSRSLCGSIINIDDDNTERFHVFQAWITISTSHNSKR